VKEATSLSEAVIKSENIQMVAMVVNRPPSRFSRFGSGREEHHPAPEKKGEAAPEVRSQTPQEDLEERLQAVEQEAYARGFSEGVKKGAEMERVNLRSTAETVSAFFKELSRLREEIFRSSEGEVLDLAFSIAEKVLHQEVSTNRDVASAVLKTAMKDVLDREGLKIRLSPLDYHHLTEVNPDAIRGLEELRNAEIEADESIGPGGVVIETLFGEVDARIDRQLNEVREAMSRPEEH
jgi:flagellar assembly protein FliH